MIAKCISMALVFLLATSVPHIALAQAGDDTKQVQMIKEKIRTAGTKGKTTVSVTLRDGAKLKGRIASIGDDSFVLMNQKTNLEVSIPYADVKSAGTSKGLSRLAKIGIGFAIGIAVLFGVCYGGDHGCGYG